MKTLSLNCLFFLSFFAGCVFESSMMQTPAFIGSQDDCGFAVNHFSGEGLRWDKSKFPVVFRIHETVPLEAEKNFISSVDHWNLMWRDFLDQKGLKPFELFYVDKSGIYEGHIRSDGNNLILFVNDNFSRYDSPRSQAITALSSKGASILDADIVVNAQTFKFHYDSQYNQTVLAANEFEGRYLASLKTPGLWFQITKKLKLFFQFLLKAFTKTTSVRKIADFRPEVPKDKVDFPSLMIHELGHVPGRAHFEGNSSNRPLRSRSGSAKEKAYSVMEPTLSKGRARRKIPQSDLENLFCAYYNY